MASLSSAGRATRCDGCESGFADTALTVTHGAMIEKAVAQPDRVPTGNRGQTSGPLEICRATDGWILVAVTGSPLYRRWARLMRQPGPGGPLAGDPDWLYDPRFADDDARGRHGVILSERLARWCALRNSDDGVRNFGEAMIPCAPVLSPQQALDHPQVQALGLLQDTDYPGLPRPAPVAAVPIWMTETAAVPRRRAPLLGEHTEQILASLGYDVAAIAHLRERAVI